MQNRLRVDSQTLLVMSSLFISVIFLLVSKFKIGYPIVDFMSSPIGRFDDYRNPLIYAPQLFESRIGVGFTPLQVLIYQILSWFPFYIGLLVSSLIPLVSIYLGTRKSLENKFVFSILICLYPILFCLARGNNDLWVFSLLVFFYVNLVSNKQRASGIFLSLAASIDPLVSIFALFYIRRLTVQFWKWFISMSSMLFVLPCLVYGVNPFLELRFLFDQYSSYRQGMVSGDAGLLFSNALSGTFKGFYLIQYSTLIPLKTLDVLLISTNLLGVLFLVYIIFQLSSVDYPQKIPMLFLDFVAFLVLFGSASPDYKLIFFLIPLLVNWNDSLGESLLLPILFILLFLPKHFIWYQFDFNPVGFTINSILNPIIIVIILTVISTKSRKVIVKNASSQ